MVICIIRHIRTGFLWAVFYCSLIGFVSKYLFKGKWIGYVIIIIGNYFIPAVANTTGAKRLMPFFILGILLNQYEVLARLKKTNVKIITFIVLCVCYAAAMFIVPDVELFTGITGSLRVCFVFWVISDYCKFGLLTKFGQVSIGIYLFTGIIFYFVIKDYCRITESYRYAIRAGYVFGLSIVLTLLSYWLCKLLGNWKITGILFLGKERSRKKMCGIGTDK